MHLVVMKWSLSCPVEVGVYFGLVIAFGEIFESMKNTVFWDVVPCSSCLNRHFGGTYRLHLQGRKIRERGTSVSWLLQSARRHIPENCILHSHRRENLKSYVCESSLHQICELVRSISLIWINMRFYRVTFLTREPDVTNVNKNIYFRARAIMAKHF
jgi:hypothetical protein